MDIEHLKGVFKNPSSNQRWGRKELANIRGCFWNKRGNFWCVAWRTLRFDKAAEEIFGTVLDSREM